MIRICLIIIIENTEEIIPAMIVLCSIPAMRSIFLSKFGELFFPSDKSEKGVGKLMGHVFLFASMFHSS